MTNTEIVKEEIDINVDNTTLDTYLHVTQKSTNNIFDFDTSIDEAGNILLTPTDNNCEFIAVDILTEQEFKEFSDMPETDTTDDLTIKESTIHIQSNVLSEDNDLTIESFVDNIGQVVLCFKSDKNTFLSATIDNSLNLITEGLSIIGYFGYTFTNSGNGWDITDSKGELLKSGVETVYEAKVFACNQELSKLKKLHEEKDTTTPQESTPTEEGEEDSRKPEVSAEVLDESLNTDANLEDALSELTNQFTDTDGTIQCDTLDELKDCLIILIEHYTHVEYESSDKGIFIKYNTVVPVEV